MIVLDFSEKKESYPTQIQIFDLIAKNVDKESGILTIKEYNEFRLNPDIIIVNEKAEKLPGTPGVSGETVIEPKEPRLLRIVEFIDLSEEGNYGKHALGITTTDNSTETGRDDSKISQSKSRNAKKGLNPGEFDPQAKSGIGDAVKIRGRKQTGSKRKKV